MISGHQEFFFLAIWWAGYFFPFFSHKLSITFVLHAIFFFRQALAGIFFSKSPTPHTPPPQELNGQPLEAVYLIKRFHTPLGQQLSKILRTKEKVRFYIRKRFNSHRINLGHQHGHFTLSTTSFSLCPKFIILNVLSFITIVFYKKVYGEVDGNFLANF